MIDGEKLTAFQGLMDQAYARWTYDTNWTFERFLLDLNYLERVAVLCGTLNYQVENGGFTQWHDNGYSVGRKDLVRILAEIEGPATVEVLQLLAQVEKAIRAYEGAEARRSTRNSGMFCDTFDDGEDSFNEFFENNNALDTQFYQINEAFCTEVETYLAACVSEAEARGGQ